MPPRQVPLQPMQPLQPSPSTQPTQPTHHKSQYWAPPSPRFHGACLCGGITYVLTRRPRRVIECHCSHCQADGGHCQIMAEYRTEEVVVQDPLGFWKIYTIREGTLSGQPKEKHFCGNCGCTLWTVAMRDKGELRMVRTSLVENGLQLFPPTEVRFKRKTAEEKASAKKTNKHGTWLAVAEDDII